MTSLTPAIRFFAPEITKIRLIPTIAAVDTGPTTTERDAGTVLTDIADISGWTVTGGSIATPDLQTRFTKSISGRTTAADSSITFYGSRDAVDVRTVFARGDRAFIEIADGGDEPGAAADIYPVEVSSVGKVRSVGDQAFQVTVSFTITGVPIEDYVIPTGV